MKIILYRNQKKISILNKIKIMYLTSNNQKYNPKEKIKIIIVQYQTKIKNY